MAQCSYCGASGADPDIGVCYQCYIGDSPLQPPEPNDYDVCGAHGHPRYRDSDRCYCGVISYQDPGRGDVVPIDELF